MNRRFHRRCTAIAVSLLLGTSGNAFAQRFPETFSQQGGENIFKSLCQACHMPDAKGAVGAGTYPSLAANPKLAGAGYPLTLVVNGYKAMPALGRYLTDQQIADVVNYVRTHFGNHYQDTVKVADVRAVRAAAAATTAH